MRECEEMAEGMGGTLPKGQRLLELLSLNSLIFEKIRLVINSFKILEQRDRDPN